MAHQPPKRTDDAPYPPPGSNDPHEELRGETAEDERGVGHGEEGYVAADYPGHQRFQGEAREEHLERLSEQWGGPHELEDDGDEPFEPLAPHEAERIHRTLCERLAQMERSCRDLRFGLRRRTVLLSGVVPDQDAKHEIEGVCSTIPGVDRVVSRLEVARG